MRILVLHLLVALTLETYSQSQFTQLLKSYYESYLQLNASVASSIGDYRYNDQLENSLSKPYRDQVAGLYARYMDSLKRFDLATLSARDKLSYQIFSYDLERNLIRLLQPTYLTPLSQMGDFRISFSQLGAGSGNHPFKTVKDYEDFLKRINSFVAITDTAISNLRQGVIVKRVHPRIVVEKVIPQVKSMITDTVSKSLFYGPIRNLPAQFSETPLHRTFFQVLFPLCVAFP